MAFLNISDPAILNTIENADDSPYLENYLTTLRGMWIEKNGSWPNLVLVNGWVKTARWATAVIVHPSPPQIMKRPAYTKQLADHGLTVSCPEGFQVLALTGPEARHSNRWRWFADLQRPWRTGKEVQEPPVVWDIITKRDQLVSRLVFSFETKFHIWCDCTTLRMYR